MLKKIIVIVGPTATNKTNLAIEIAKLVNGEMINADAFQVYKQMNIGVNKPKSLITKNIHLMDMIEPNDNWDIFAFQQKANEIIKSIDIPIIIGGSHLYIDALIKNYDLTKAPNRDDKFNDLTNEQLFNALSLKNKEIANKITINNRKRLIRAMQVLELNNSMNNRNKPIYDPLIIVCTKPREQLYNDINKRVVQMKNEGWVDEVKSLIKQYPNYESLNSFKAIGYLDIANSLKNNTEVDWDKIAQKTRNYAKRQITWIKHHYVNFLEFNQENLKEIEIKVQQWLKK